LPEVSIYPAYSAAAMIAVRVDVDEAVSANKIKALAGHDRTAYLFARLQPHDLDRKCACYVCDNTPSNPDKFNRFKRASWMQNDPLKPYVRFDMGARNVRLAVQGGEHFVVVAACDVDAWLAELAGSGRLGMMLALPLTIERKSKREVAA